MRVNSKSTAGDFFIALVTSLWSTRNKRFDRQSRKNGCDEALDCLERAVEKGTVSADWIRNDADLVSLRSAPRHARSLEKVGT